MEIKTFWNIILKIFGLWLLLESIYILPQFVSTVSTLGYGNSSDTFLVWGILLMVMILYLLIFRTLIFNTSWLINKLKLANSFQEQRIDLNIGTKTVLSIAVIIIGGLVFIESLPSLCRELFSFFQQEALLKDYPETGWIVFHFIRALAGYLMMTNSRTIVGFINRKSGAE